MAERIDRLAQFKTLIDAELTGTVVVYYFNNILEVLRQQANIEDNIEVQNAVLKLAKCYADFYNAKQISEDEFITRLDALEQSYIELIELVKDKPYFIDLKKPLQFIASTVLGLVFGALGLCYGTLHGIYRSCLERQDPVRLLIESMLAGLVIPFIAGRRLPEKFFKDEHKEKLLSTLIRLNYLHKGLSKTLSDGENSEFDVTDSISQKMDELTESTLQELVKREIIESCFSKAEDKEKAFNDFLTDHHVIQVCTRKAEFGMKHLKGYLGHHSFIRLAVGETDLLPIEFGPPFTNPPKFVDQAEELRVIDGQTMFDMLVNHKRCKSIQTFNRDYMTTQYMPGEHDCRTYVNQILESVGLARSQISRFVPSIDSNTGTQLYRPALTSTCFFKQGELNAGAAPKEIKVYKREDYQAFEAEQSGGKKVTRDMRFDFQLRFTDFHYDQRQAVIENFRAQSQLNP